MRQLKPYLAVLILAVAVAALPGCSYNKFVSQEETVKAQWAQVQNQLQRRNDLVEDAYLGRRREWFACACCPPNIMRLVASLGAYVATTTDAGLQLHQRLLDVILVCNVSDDLLQNILNSYQPGSASIFIHNNRQLQLLPPELVQQFIDFFSFRYIVGWSKHFL